MPKKALKPCGYPGCPELVESGYCKRHAHARNGAFVREPNRQRLYDRRWQKIRERQFAQHPWCEMCLKDGRHIPATDVHHVIRHGGDINLFYTSPLMSLCHECHSRLTSAEVRGEGAEKVLH
jgi:5-methylcytosine-specific restriction protein A